MLSEYIGTGYAAELIALLDEHEREQARAKRTGAGQRRKRSAGETTAACCSMFQQR